MFMDTAATLLNAMKVSISEIFETMFYMPVEFEEKADLESVIKSSSFMVSHLSFTGPVKGKFVVLLPVSLLRFMAAGFMGTDESEVNHEEMTGTITEITNMIAGNTLTFVGGDFHLDLPELDAQGKADQQQEKLAENPSASRQVFVKTLNGILGVRFYIF